MGGKMNTRSILFFLVILGYFNAIICFRYGPEDIISAVENGNLPLTKKILQENVNLLHARAEEDKQSLLHIAIERNHVKVIKFLLKNGIDVNAKDDFGWSALHLAVYFKNLNIVKLLVTNKADVNSKITTKSGLNNTPLHIAAKKGCCEILEYLIEMGADFNQFNKFFYAPIHTACVMGNVKMVDFLLKKGCDINMLGGFAKDGLLNLAVDGNNIQMVELLLEHGIDCLLNVEDIPSIYTAIADNKNVEIVRLIIEKNKEVDSEKINKLKNLALQFACEYGKKEIVEYLFSRGVYCDGGDNGRSAMRNACISGNLDLVKLLVKKGVNIRDFILGKCRNRDKVALLLDKYNQNIKALADFKNEIEQLSKDRHNTDCCCPAYEYRKKINKLMLSEFTPTYDKQLFIEFLLKNHSHCLSSGNVSQFFLQIPFNEIFFTLRESINWVVNKEIVDCDGDDITYKSAIFNIPGVFQIIFSAKYALYNIEEFSRKLFLERDKTKKLNKHTYTLLKALEIAKKRKSKRYFRDVVNTILVSDYLNKFLVEGDHPCRESSARGIVAKILAFTGGDFNKKFGLTPAKKVGTLKGCVIH